MSSKTKSPKKAPVKSPRKKPSPRKTGAAAARSPATDLTSDEALRALPADYADSPDMPVKVAQLELASLARLAQTVSGTLAKVGIVAGQSALLQRFASRLGTLESAWQRARTQVTLTAIERRRLTEAEELEKQLVAGGRWACRKDSEAQAELGRIVEGSGLADTIQDLHDLVKFWAVHLDELACTDITAKNLARATELADVLAAAAAKETASLQASAALDLRNRCFWAADELAKEIREGGRYVYRLQPKTAAKFTSRYRAAQVRRARRKPKDPQAPALSPAA